ncbi:pentapeptide repeat-containing protein [Streptomyces echinatus]|uniref:Uncharacterized protein YjbI with pentapeptide repeats n=1 Tax=Streptomyces echinatus TaxID=67293 RepID=A0A7W9PWQ8_9ACTN|nr:pentapeptide repeat-containing protein [Streptomyces echinatus]MBB5929336.1 uncharacterized protein YjbI with pentapeptide repeats [Streptomyces echinatus]
MRETLRGAPLWATRALLPVLCLAVVVGLPLIIWRGPWWFDGKYLPRSDINPAAAALITGFRTAAVQTVAAVGAGIALLYTARTYRLNHRGQVTDRFTKALERLGSEHLYVRIGGVLALEQILHDAPEQAMHAARVLGAFIRDRAPGRASSPVRDRGPYPVVAPLPNRPDEDVQAALTALTRPSSRRYVDQPSRIDLSGLHLQGADLTGADLSGIVCNDADLTDTQLAASTLTNAYLDGVILAGANLTRANLTGARLNKANLTGARLLGADCTGAQFEDANLTRVAAYLRPGGEIVDKANFTRAYLCKANLTLAEFHGAIFDRAYLLEANLSITALYEVDLRTAGGLTLAQVTKALLDERTQLPKPIADDPAIEERIRESVP